MDYSEIKKDLSVSNYFKSFLIIDLETSTIKEESTESFTYKSKEELNELISYIKGAAWKARVKGIIINGTKYTPIKSEEGKIYGQCQTSGCCLVRANTIGIIAVYTDFKLYDHCTRLIESVTRDIIKKQKELEEKEKENKK